MNRRSLATAGVAAGLALLPSVARADVRLEERITSLDSTVTRWTFMKGDKRSVVTRAEVGGVLLDAGAKYGAYVEIARPDLELIWELDPQERSYREITFSQFSKLLQRGIQVPRSADEQPLRTLYRSETTTVEVVPTGKTRKIAGLDAEQVMGRVVVGATNLVSGRKFVFTFDQEVWLTKDAQFMQQLQAFEEAYTERFGTAASLQQVQVLAGPWNDSFITHLRALNDRIRALKGYPLASTTTVTEQSVAADKSEKGTTRKFTVSSAEVRRVSYETLPDGEFELPAGYINADTKVAVAKPLPVPEAAPTAPAAPPVKPAPMPVVAANPPVKPAAEPVKPAVEPEKPAAEPVKPAVEPARPAAPPVVAANPPAAPVPSPVATARPGNVVVKGGPAPTAPAAAPAVVAANAARGQEGVFDSPTLAYFLSVPTRSGPSQITVDEPEQLTKRKGKRKSTFVY